MWMLFCFVLILVSLSFNDWNVFANIQIATRAKSRKVEWEIESEF